MMPKFTSVDVLFTRAPEGLTFNSSYPRIFGRPWTYLVTEAQKEALEQRLNRFVLMSLVLVSRLVALGHFVLFRFPGFADRLEAGSPEAWLLVFVVWIVIASTLIIPAIFFIRHRVIQSTLRTAMRIGPAQPDWLRFIILKKMIRRKSANVLILWRALLLLFHAYGTIIYAWDIPAPRALMLFSTVPASLAALFYASL